LWYPTRYNLTHGDNYLRYAQIHLQLRDAGFEEKQAEALTEALLSAIEDSELVTRKDLQIELAPIKSDLTVVKWMLGLLHGGVAALILKGFF